MHSEPSQTSKMEIYAKIVNGRELLTIFAKSFILDVWLGSEYVSVYIPLDNNHNAAYLRKKKEKKKQKKKDPKIPEEITNAEFN